MAKNIIKSAAAPVVTKASVLAKVRAAKSPAERKAAKEPIVSRTATVKKMIKAKAPKAKAVKAERATYQPTATIKVVKLREVRDGSTIGMIWNMVASSKTVGAYMKKREKAGLEGLGGYLGYFVKAGLVKIGK